MGREAFYQVRHPRGKMSEWIIIDHPGGYHKMACCDCGLVHNMDFRAWLIDRKNGKKVGYHVMSRRAVVIALRVGRNAKATANRRRLKKHKKIREAFKK